MGPRLRLIRLRWMGQQGDKAAVDKEAVVEAAVEGKSGGENHSPLQTTSTNRRQLLPTKDRQPHSLP